jgi:hypothetical protein
MHETFCSQNDRATLIVAVFTKEKEAFRRTRLESLAHFGAPGMPAPLRRKNTCEKYVPPTYFGKIRATHLLDKLGGLGIV